MRLTTINVDKFQHDGLVVDKGWTQFNYAKADAKAQASFRDHVGRFVQIHPEDIAGLAKLGLALEDGRIVDAKPPEVDPPKSEKGDAGGAGTAKSEGANGKAAAAKGKGEESKAATADDSAKGKDAAK